jgi:hypothetical protein
MSPSLREARTVLLKMRAGIKLMDISIEEILREFKRTSR